MATEFAVPAVTDVDLGTVLSALADPVRRAVVLDLLARAEPPADSGTTDSGAAGSGRVDGEHACSSFALPVAKSTRTHHWRVLREAGLIRQRDLGNGSRVRLRRDEFDARFPGLLDAVRAATGPTAG